VSNESSHESKPELDTQRMTVRVLSRITLIQSFLLRFVLVLNSVLPFWGLLVFEFLIGLPEIPYTVSVCSSNDNCPARSASAADIVC
jgi:hypothetical protein